MLNQLEQSEKKDLTMEMFVTSANETTINGFWRDHVTENLRTSKSFEILGFLSSC